MDWVHQLQRRFRIYFIVVTNKFRITHLVKDRTLPTTSIINGCVYVNLMTNEARILAIQEWVDDNVDYNNITVTTDTIYSTTCGWLQNYYVEFDNDVDALMFKLKWL